MKTVAYHVVKRATIGAHKGRRPTCFGCGRQIETGETVLREEIRVRAGSTYAVARYFHGEACAFAYTRRIAYAIEKLGRSKKA